MQTLHSKTFAITPLVVPNGKLRTAAKARGSYVLHPTEIRTEQRIFLLSRPLSCTLSKQEDCWIAENEELMLLGTGATRQAAEEEFAECFSELYNAYVEHFTKHFTEVSPDAALLRNSLQELVRNIYEATQK
jgi:hypothetical protein